METAIIEVTNGPNNWGKFMLTRFGAKEWSRLSIVEQQALEEDTENELAPMRPRPLLGVCDWDRHFITVMDLQTKEAVGLRHDPYMFAKFNTEHQVWVCPLFEPFLIWLGHQDISDFSKLPRHVDLPPAIAEWRGYRRPGPDEQKRQDILAICSLDDQDARARLRDLTEMLLDALRIVHKDPQAVWGAEDQYRQAVAALRAELEAEGKFEQPEK